MHVITCAEFLKLEEIYNYINLHFFVALRELHKNRRDHHCIKMNFRDHHCIKMSFKEKDETTLIPKIPLYGEGEYKGTYNGRLIKKISGISFNNLIEYITHKLSSDFRAYTLSLGIFIRISISAEDIISTPKKITGIVMDVTIES